MKNKINVHSYFLILLMITVLFLLIYLFTYDKIETILMPAAVCGICFILAVVQFRKELTEKKNKTSPAEDEHTHDEEDGKPPEKSELRSYIIGFSWVIGFFIAVLLIGFLISTPLFVFIYMITHHRTILASFITTAVMGGSIYALSTILQMYLYPGIIFGG